MIGMDILQPVVALAIWTMVMWLWMYATRIPAMVKANLDADQLVRDPNATFDNALPVKTQWKAHNYNHLHEQPTIFYAVAITLAIIGHGDGINATLAWIYVAIRILHSLIQATVNKVIIRFGLFALSSIVLMVLIFHASVAVFDLHI